MSTQAETRTSTTSGYIPESLYTNTKSEIILEQFDKFTRYFKRNLTVGTNLNSEQVLIQVMIHIISVRFSK